MTPHDKRLRESTTFAKEKLSYLAIPDPWARHLRGIKRELMAYLLSWFHGRNDDDPDRRYWKEMTDRGPDNGWWFLFRCGKFATKRGFQRNAVEVALKELEEEGRLIRHDRRRGYLYDCFVTLAPDALDRLSAPPKKNGAQMAPPLGGDHLDSPEDPSCNETGHEEEDPSCNETRHDPCNETRHEHATKHGMEHATKHGITNTLPQSRRLKTTTTTAAVAAKPGSVVVGSTSSSPEGGPVPPSDPPVRSDRKPEPAGNLYYDRFVELGTYLKLRFPEVMTFTDMRVASEYVYDRETLTQAGSHLYRTCLVARNPKRSNGYDHKPAKSACKDLKVFFAGGDTFDECLANPVVRDGVEMAPGLSPDEGDGFTGLDNPAFSWTTGDLRDIWNGQTTAEKAWEDWKTYRAPSGASPATAAAGSSAEAGKDRVGQGGAGALPPPAGAPASREVWPPPGRELEIAEPDPKNPRLKFTRAEHKARGWTRIVGQDFDVGYSLAGVNRERSSTGVGPRLKALPGEADEELEGLDVPELLAEFERIRVRLRERASRHLLEGHGQYREVHLPPEIVATQKREAEAERDKRLQAEEHARAGAFQAYTQS